MILLNLESDLKALRMMHKAAVSEVTKAETDITNLNSRLTVIEEATRLCQFCLREQTELLESIELAVTALLQDVLGEGYSFKYEPTFSASDKTLMTGVKKVIVQNGIESYLTLSDGDQGGGATEVACFGEFLAVHMLLNLPPIVFMDEPLGKLRSDRFAGVINFVERLQEFSPFQLVMVTHEDKLFDNTLEVYKKGTTSYVREGTRTNNE